MLEQNSQSFLVLRGGRIVHEVYAAGFDKDSTRVIHSASKSMLSILVGQAIDDGFIKSVEQPVADSFFGIGRKRTRRRLPCDRC